MGCILWEWAGLVFKWGERSQFEVGQGGRWAIACSCGGGAVACKLGWGLLLLFGGVGWGCFVKDVGGGAWRWLLREILIEWRSYLIAQ